MKDDELLVLVLGLVVLWLWLSSDTAVAAPAVTVSAQPLRAAVPQLTDGCIAQRPAVTALDDATMLAAYTASFRGIFGRDPTMQPGSGSDDGWYWIGVSNHFGAFGDNVCRAGWSAYWEQKLAGADSVDSALGDVPATYQP